MRYHRLRFDIWFCLLLSYLVAMGVGKSMDVLMPNAYEKYEQEHIVASGEIGGIALDDVFRVQNVDDILSHDQFTIISPGITYRNEGAGYFDGKYLYNVVLPSGQRVAAYINMDSVQQTGEDIYSGDSILPVGCVVKANLKEEENFMEQIEYGYPLSRTDFYIDMVGKGAKMNEETYSETSKIIPQLVSGFITFACVHALGSKFGIFPAFFSFKKKQTSKWD